MFVGKRAGFTLIEFLIALVIIGFIVAILVGVFSSPLKQAKTDSAVSQVKDGLRQMAEAALLAYAKGDPCVNDGDYGSSCADPAVLVAGGYLAAPAAIPAGINATGTTAQYQYYSAVPGGCGPDNAGSGATDMTPIMLHNVSEEFCRAYNLASGNGDIIVPSCSADASKCAGSGSTSGSTPAAGYSATFCFLSDENPGFEYYSVYYPTGIPYAPCQ